MNRVPSAPIDDGLQKSTETWALGVSDALAGVYGKARRTRVSGVSVEPTSALVAGNGIIATVFIEFPACTTSSASVWFLEQINRAGVTTPLPLNGILLVMDLSDMSITGQIVTDGIAFLANKTYTNGFALSGSLSLME